MPAPSLGPGMLKFVTIALFITALSGIVLGVARAGIHYSKTGEVKPLIESTFGQIVFWDNQIYEGIEYLRDDSFMQSLPPSFQKDFKNFVTKQIVFYLMLFIILGFGMYKLGNWIAGRASLDPTTDLLIIALIIFVIFPFSEFLYGYAMYGETVVPYRGIAQMVRPSTWELLLDSTDVGTDDIYQQYVNNELVSSETVEPNVILNLTTGGG